MLGVGGVTYFWYLQISPRKNCNCFILWNTQKQKRLPRFRVTTFRLLTEGQESFYSIEDHHRPNIQIPRTVFLLAFYYCLFQMQMKSRTRDHAIMQSFAWFSGRKKSQKRFPELRSRVVGLSWVFCSCRVTSCLRKPSPCPDIQRTFDRATKAAVKEQSGRPDCDTGRWQGLLDVGRKAFPTAALTRGPQLRFY